MVSPEIVTLAPESISKTVSALFPLTTSIIGLGLKIVSVLLMTIELVRLMEDPAEQREENPTVSPAAAFATTYGSEPGVEAEPEQLETRSVEALAAPPGSTAPRNVANPRMRLAATNRRRVRMLRSRGRPYPR